MASWHSWDEKQYDKANQDAITSRPVDGPIKDKLSTATYVLNYTPFKTEFILSAQNGQGDDVFYAPKLDPLSTAFWARIPEVSRGPITGTAPQFSGTYAQVAIHANRLNKAESERTGGPVHLYSVELAENVAA